MDVEPVVAEVVRRYAGTPGALLPILHGVQHALGHIPREAVPRIATALNLSRAEVHGVVSFYHDFRETLAGRHRLTICRAESCQAVGADELVASATRRAGVPIGETTPDGALTVAPVYCLGLCAVSPAIMVDGEVRGRVTGDELDALLDALLDSKAVP